MTRDSAIAESVQAWRPAAIPGALCLHGTTQRYAIDPIAECVFGIITSGAMQARRGRERYVFQQGDLAMWDPSAPHRGMSYGQAQWEARLIILQLPAVEDLLLDPDAPPFPVRFDSAPVRNPLLAESFVNLHRASERQGSALMQSDLLHEWFRQLAGGREQETSARRARRDLGLRRACELLRDDPTANVTLTQLAAVARISRHRLSRLFRSAYGCPPHQFLLAQRVRLARSLIDVGTSITEAAQRSGFSDQSHLHRHLKRSLGLTPGEYGRLRSNVQDRTRTSPR